jgi:Right handed beta helix region
MGQRNSRISGKLITTFGLGIGLIGIGALAPKTASAAMLRVGSCPGATFSTIQAAVNASAGGDTVQICPGTYREQVTIAKNLTLVGIESNTADAAVITSPKVGMIPNVPDVESPIAAGIAVRLALVNIANVVVDGSKNGFKSCSVDVVGIFFQNTTGSIDHVATRNQELGPGLSGCQDGEGIWIQGKGTVTVTNSSVHAFQKNGITVNESGTSATIAYNTIEGQGPTSGASENGVQVGFGARATVQFNSIIDSIWAPDTILDPEDSATGILVYASQGVVVTRNTVGNTQNAIVFVGDDQAGSANDGQVTYNQVFGTHIFDGIILCSDNNFAGYNTVNHSDEAGINLQGQEACGLVQKTGNNNNVVGNSINEACAGILKGPDTSGNSLLTNAFYNDVNTILTANSCPAIVSLAAASARSFSDGPKRFQPIR